MTNTRLPLEGMTGCEKVPFAPRIDAVPSSDVTDSPSGSNFDLHVLNPEEAQGVAESDVRSASVTFPLGLTVNPSSADGLAACSEAQAGFTGFAERTRQANPVRVHRSSRRFPHSARMGQSSGL